MHRFPLIATMLACGAANAQPFPLPGTPLRIGPDVSSPTVVFKVAPEYSEEAFFAKREGVVVLSLVVQKDGTATDVRIVRSLGLGLDEKAMDAVKQWRFQPGKKDGQPVPVFATVEVTFYLPRWRLDNAQCKRPAGPVFPRSSKETYPPSIGTAKRTSVSLSYQVDEQGNPRNIRVEGSSDPHWDGPAVTAVSQWRYEPIMQNNQPVSFSCNIKLEYR
jgi:TonB family protein